VGRREERERKGGRERQTDGKQKGVEERGKKRIQTAKRLLFVRRIFIELSKLH